MPEPAVATRLTPNRVRWARLIGFGLVLFIAIMTAYVYTVFAWRLQPVKVAEDFHKMFYNSSHTWENNKWLGVPIEKNPLDLMIYQEMIHELKPDLIIEAGTADGGSAYFMACMMDLLQHGKIMTIDIVDSPLRPKHPRIEYLMGSSTSPEIVAKIKNAIHPGDKVMVVLDSDHSKAHVLKEMTLYGPMVTKGSYMIVEDTDINGHPVRPEFGPGPMEALREYMKDHSEFQIDKARERLFFSFNPEGYLRKIRD